jgi:hypothetical protein
MDLLTAAPDVLGRGSRTETSRLVPPEACGGRARRFHADAACSSKHAQRGV